MNILVTGKRNIGKSTLVNTIAEELNLCCSGFKTLPFIHYKNGESYKMVNLKTNTWMPISIFDGVKNKGISDTFSTFGIPCLLDAQKDESHVIVIDELGRFERMNTDFIQQVHNVLQCPKTTIIVLKAEDIDYINEIKKRSDCLLFNLDKISFFEAKKRITDILKEKHVQQRSRSLYPCR